MGCGRGRGGGAFVWLDAACVSPGGGASRSAVAPYHTPPPGVQSIASIKKAALLQGPSVFTLQRQEGLYHCLLCGNDPAGPACSSRGTSAELLHQLSTVISLGFLERVSEASDLTAVKLRCAISLDSAIDIAKSLPFSYTGAANLAGGDKGEALDLAKYLYDPAA